MKAKSEITIKKEFARTLRDAIQDHRWCDQAQDYLGNPLGARVRCVTTQAYEVADGRKVIGIPVTLEGTTIGDVELTVDDTLTLIQNLTNAVRNSL